MTEMKEAVFVLLHDHDIWSKQSDVSIEGGSVCDVTW